MKLYLQSIRDGQTLYTICDGMDESIVISLMEEIGHTDIQVIEEQTYLDNQPII